MQSLRQLFLDHVAQTSKEPLMLEVTGGNGVYLHTNTGEKYLDLISGISVSSLGHGDEDVVQAVKDQAERYMHTMVYGEHVQAPQVLLAEALCKQLPDGLDSVYFVNSGSEAVEGALKLAKKVTGRTKIIACGNAYHGSTHGAMSVMSDPYFTQAYRPLLAGVSFIEFNNLSVLENIGSETACVITETVQAEAGVRLPERAYLKKLKARCEEVGALLILDEIQVGYGRTGTLFAFQQYDVQPDILLLAKAMGGGMPIGAFVASKERMAVFTEDPVLGHITTFGGHPVCCAAGLACLNKLTNSKLIEDVKKKELLFRTLLDHPKIQAIRSAGFLMAVELESEEIMHLVIQEAFKRKIIVDWFLFDNKSFRIAPPLIISEEEIRQVCNQLNEAIDGVYSMKENIRKKSKIQS